MSTSDSIVDFLTRICNVNMTQHESAEAPASKMKKDIAEILKNEGFIHDVEYADNNKQGIICVFLKYGNDGQRAIPGLKRISKPGLRTCAKSDTVPKVPNGLGIAIISTSEGVVTDKVAHAKKIGGGVTAYVW